jgi:hypothetical protein
MSGSGDLDAELQSDAALELNMQGPGQANLRGKAKSLTAKVSGSGDLRASELLLDSASIKVTGPGEAEVNVKKTGGSRIVKIDRNGVAS